MGTISVSALVVLVLTLVVSGVLYRRGLAHLNRANARVAFERDSLRNMPGEIGDWVGVDRSFDKWIVKAADVDDYLLREFTNRETGERVTLYIAAGARSRDLFPHRPQVCYPAHGMTMIGKELVEIGKIEDSSFEANIFDFRPGGMNGHQMGVLNYFVVDGQTSPDESLIRARARSGQSSVRYVAQVQITQSRSQTQEDDVAHRTLVNFARLTAQDILTTLETQNKRAEEKAAAAESQHS
ncbi:MAG: exosortase-associated EpsI family protein [Phycisphaerae bacterium]